MCEYNNNIIIYKEDNVKNIINLNTQEYERDTEDYKFNLDFDHNTFKYTLKEKNYVFGDKLKEGKIRKEEKKIIIIYGIDKDRKKIIIEFL